MDDIQPESIATLIKVSHRYDGTVCKPDADDLNFMHWNVNHLTNKLQDVELHVASFPGLLHVVAISETWLNVNNFQVYQLRNYTSIHNIRSSEGGGISIFIHDTLCNEPPTVLANVTTSLLHHFLVVELRTINTTIAVPYNRPRGSNHEPFLVDLETYCLNIPNCLLMGDLNMNQLNCKMHEQLNEMLESHEFGLLNSVSHEAATRLKSGTILDVVATNMLSNDYKLSIVNNDQSDHGILYVSINRQKPHTSTAIRTKPKLNLEAAICMVSTLAESVNIKNGNQLNTALEDIVGNCTRTVRIKSDHRIRRSHVNRELILAVRERGRLFSLMNLYPDNEFIERKYMETVTFINSKNNKLRSAFEFERIESAGGDCRKSWRLFKEIVFNQYQVETDHPMTIDGIPVTDSVESCNAVNEHFCAAGR